MTICPAHLITEWLARQHSHPDQAETEWVEQGVALLPMGKDMNAVRLRGDLVHAVAATDDPKQVAAVLDETLGGPVIRDRLTAADVTYYALINPHAAMVWDLEEQAPCFGKDTYLGVPAVDRVSPPGPYWVHPPRYDGDLCSPQAVRDLVIAGLNHLHPAER
ncbi:hypothetical protein [Streptomyces prunicolor]|uniref:hypothetical protein n=1 Tax=Streptomyces prunicolor TaxID=67348 RepID=UPI00035E6BC8|nr:hypothetical protein [Streptomyces prunicolor]